MRIAFVAEPWDDIGPAGGGSSVAIVTTRLSARLARRAAISIYSAKRRPGRPDIEYDAAGIAYRRIPVVIERSIHRAIIDLEPNIDAGWFRLPYFASSFYYRGYARRIARDLLRHPVDIVHVQSFSQFVPIIRKLNPRVKIVLHLHSDQFVLLDRARAVERLRQADLVLGPSEHTVGRLRERFPEFAARCRVLANGVDLEGFAPPAQTPVHAPDDELRCLYVGRVSPEKGIHVLLDAFARFREAFPRTRLEIYGSNVPIPYNFFVGLSGDPAMRTLKEYFTGTPFTRLQASLRGRRHEYFAALERRHGQSFGRSVFFHGAVPQERVRDAYRNADLFVLPSVCHESFSLVLLEAMACALPFVATRAGGIIEAAAAAGAGLVVERNDPGALAAALRELAADPARRARMGQRGRAFAACETFAWDRVAERLWAYYDELVSRPSHEAGAALTAPPAATF